MSYPVTEIVYWTLKHSISLTDSSPEAHAFAETLQTLSKQPGHISTYYGRTVEIPDLLIMMINWQTLDSHKTFIASPQYTPFVTKIQPLISSVYFHHFSPSPSSFPPSLLSLKNPAPVVEFATFFSIQDSFPHACREFVKKIGTPKGNVGESVCGESVELIRRYRSSKKADEGRDGEKDEGKKEEEGEKGYILMIGWETLKDHEKFRETDVFKENVGLIRGNHGGVEMFHVQFITA